MKRKLFSNKFFAILSMSVIFLFLVSPVQAFEPREGEDVVIAQGEVIADDLYVTANTIRIEGTIKGDLVAFGSLVVIAETGVVEQDLLAGAQGVVINGVVKDDARVAAAVISIGENAKVMGDLVAGGYSVETRLGSLINRDAIIGAGVVSLNGGIGRNLLVGAGGLAINGTVNGDARVEVGGEGDAPPFSPLSFMPTVPGMPVSVQVANGLSIGADAQIKGDLNYSAPVQASLREGAIAGKVVYTAPAPQPADEQPVEPTATQKTEKWLFSLLRSLATLLLMGFLVSYFAPGFLHQSAQKLGDKPLHSLLWGILGYIGFFFLLMVIFVVTVILAVILGVISLSGLFWAAISAGLIVSSALALGFTLLFSYVARVLVAYLIGLLIFKLVKPDLVDNRFWPAVVGIFIFVLIASIPYIGGVLSFIAALFGIGAFFLLAWEWYASRNKPKALGAPSEI